MSMSAVSGPTTTGSLSPDLLIHTHNNRFTITRPTHTYTEQQVHYHPTYSHIHRATGSLSPDLLMHTQSNRFTITRPTHTYTQQQVHHHPTFSHIHRATGSLSPNLLIHTQSNRFTITRPTHTYKATGSLSAELLINTQSNRFTITRPTHKYTEQQVHYQPTYSYIHRANYYTNTSVDYTKCTANKKGKGFPIPILVTERWARSRSRCTGSQPTSDCKSSTLL